MPLVPHNFGSPALVQLPAIYQSEAMLKAPEVPQVGNIRSQEICRLGGEGVQQNKKWGWVKIN